tara:strand:+ start:1132 stop:1497 length:366 start_codon:yes stop_codon:yes gene_type:complete
MATLTPTLTLVSTDTASDSLSVSVTDSLTVTPPSENASRTSIATGSAQALIDSNSAFQYIYIKNESGENATDFLQVKLGGNALIRLDVGEFCYMPLYNGHAVTAEAYGGACVVEYGYWTKG